MTLRERRLEKGLRQYDLARLIGTEQSRISDYESGRHTPSLATKKRIAEALEVAVHEIQYPDNPRKNEWSNPRRKWANSDKR